MIRYQVRCKGCGEMYGKSTSEKSVALFQKLHRRLSPSCKTAESIVSYDFYDPALGITESGTIDGRELAKWA